MIPENAIGEAKERKRTIEGRKISEGTRKKLLDAVDELDGPESDAVREIAHILTGDDRFEK